MVRVEILTTPGCVTCSKVERMLDKMKVKYKVIDITKNPKYLEKYPIMHAPGVVINGKLEFQGVPREEDLRKKLGK